MLRVHHTFNSKCFDEGIDPEVKAIQEFDGSKPLPAINNLLVEFMAFLTDRKLKRDLEKQKGINYKKVSFKNQITIIQPFLI